MEREKMIAYIVKLMETADVESIRKLFIYATNILKG